MKRVVVTVTDRTKMVADGIVARVVHDVATTHGRPAEVTDDWYAQDSAGNLWYLGEKTAEYENGRIASTEGSWEAGVDGAQPGVIMPARPQTGQAYRQEYYAGEAEDSARVLSTDEQVQVPFGHFRAAILTKEVTPLEPRRRRVQALRAECRPCAGPRRLRRIRPRGTDLGQPSLGWVTDRARRGISGAL